MPPAGACACSSSSSRQHPPAVPASPHARQPEPKHQGTQPACLRRRRHNCCSPAGRQRLAGAALGSSRRSQPAAALAPTSAARSRGARPAQPLRETQLLLGGDCSGLSALQGSGCRRPDSAAQSCAPRQARTADAMAQRRCRRHCRCCCRRRCLRQCRVGTAVPRSASWGRACAATAAAPTCISAARAAVRPCHAGPSSIGDTAGGAAARARQHHSLACWGARRRRPPPGTAAASDCLRRTAAGSGCSAPASCHAAAAALPACDGTAPAAGGGC